MPSLKCGTQTAWSGDRRSVFVLRRKVSWPPNPSCPHAGTKMCSLSPKPFGFRNSHFPEVVHCWLASCRSSDRFVAAPLFLSHIYQMCESPLMGLQTTCSISRSFRGQKSTVTVWAEPCHLRGLQGRLLPALPSSWGC